MQAALVVGLTLFSIFTTPVVAVGAGVGVDDGVVAGARVGVAVGLLVGVAVTDLVGVRFVVGAASSVGVGSSIVSVGVGVGVADAESAERFTANKKMPPPISTPMMRTISAIRMICLVSILEKRNPLYCT